MRLGYCVEKVTHFCVANFELTLRSHIRGFYGSHGCDRMFAPKRITNVVLQYVCFPSISLRDSPSLFFEPPRISDLTRVTHSAAKRVPGQDCCCIRQCNYDEPVEVLTEAPSVVYVSGIDRYEAADV